MIEYENTGKVNQIFFAEFERSFQDTLKSGWYILGKKVESFEEEFAAYNGVKYCIGVASGLDALLLALKVCDFPKDSEVIVPSNTYIATILAILQCGLKPVLVEPDIQTYNLDPLKIEEKITKKTKAIMPVHLYGKVCEMNFIEEIANKNNLKIIEDCAQAHGAMLNGQKAGTFGDFGAFSFYPTKNLGALGDAGAIITDNEEMAEKLKKLRNYGSSVKYYNDYIGYNSRLDEIQAGFLSIKLKSLDKINQHKRELAKIYLANLDKEKYILPVVDENYFDVYHIFNIRHKERDRLRTFLLEKDIKTEIHYPIPPHKQKCMKNINLGENFLISEEIHKTTLSLPISFFHSKEEIGNVIKTLNLFN